VPTPRYFIRIALATRRSGFSRARPLRALEKAFLILLMARCKEQ